ncbi:MAG: fumarate hydratase [Candidatus Omnitrophica bacterium]|nr:fumarate hydratase [Candidatus Omnitrophota bacterium]
MKKLPVSDITKLISGLCIEANVDLRPDLKKAISGALKREKSKSAKGVLRLLLENAAIASKNRIAICQDTGMAVVFMEIGQDVRLVGGSLKNAVNKGVKDGYKKGYLRKSVVRSPIVRENTKTNTPAILHTEIVRGKAVRVWVMPKGFGSENKSKIRMLNPSDGEKGIIDFVTRAVKEAGPEACPPFVLGVGIGGTFDHAAGLAKKALLRRIDKKNPDLRSRALEKKIMDKVNSLGIGPMGMGGKTTVFGVNILSSATHIAGLPVAVNINCHATRSAYGVL